MDSLQSCSCQRLENVNDLILLSLACGFIIYECSCSYHECMLPHLAYSDDIIIIIIIILAGLPGAVSVGLVNSE